MQQEMHAHLLCWRGVSGRLPLLAPAWAEWLRRSICKATATLSPSSALKCYAIMTLMSTHLAAFTD